MKICIDPGHGMSNRKSLVYDTGAECAGNTEAAIVMDWANELRSILRDQGNAVVRTRVDAQDPAPVSRRDDIARAYGCEVMVSLHCNAATGKASGSEVFYRGEDDKQMAEKLASAVASTLGLKNRGAKTEAESQHPSLAVMDFDKCWLIELGFIDNITDRASLLDPVKRKAACYAIARTLTT